MKTILELNIKKTYSPPQIEMIRLDNEISLQLASEDANPAGEPEWGKANNTMSNDPYKMA